MPLAMSRPWKHPKTGIYQLRKAVPEDLRKLVGKREEKVSLQTRDPAEAKVRHAKALAELEARWANLRAGPVPLTEREAHRFASAAHDRGWSSTGTIQVARPPGISRWAIGCLALHAPRNASEDYGDVTITAKAKAIGRFPSIDVS